MFSSKFVNRVLKRIEKLDMENLKDFIFALAEDRELFETIFESMIEGIIVLDERFFIQYINKPAAKLLQLKEANLIEKKFFDVLPDKHPLKFVKKLLKEHKVLNREEIHLRESVNRIVELSVYPLVKEGRISGNVVVLLDITERKEEQRKLHRAESLAALTTLAAGVAHEIKNPLGSLDIHAQLLDRISDDLDNPIKTDIKDLLQVILDEIDRLNNIVKDFLFTVRPIRIERKKMDLFELFESIIRLLKHDFEIKGVKLILDGDHTIPMVNLDGRYLNHAFLNILKNSLEACSRGDEVSIYISRDDDSLIITIHDTGKGIPHDNIEKIFEPYFTTKDFGTGLGLTIVYKIIKEHGGNITLDSVEGDGTTFEITIPCYHKEKHLLSYNVNDV